jgi:tetratricopeptide (TPR) repeat protein
MIVAGLFVALMITGLVGNVRAGNYVAIPIVFTSLSICGLAIAAKHFQVRLLLRDKTPDRIIVHYHQGARRIPQGQAAAAYLSAVAAAFFGEFDRAREELQAVDWGKATPMYKGHRLYALAVLALLEETDYPKALRLADDALELEKQDPAGGLQLLDDVIRLVAGTAPSDEMIRRLEKTAKKRTGLMPGMCAWSLAVHYRRNNQPAKSSDFKELLRMAVPYCVAMRA